MNLFDFAGNKTKLQGRFKNLNSEIKMRVTLVMVPLDSIRRIRMRDKYTSLFS